MANLSIIDPEGDYIFVCGETEIQVSSKVLSLASPVFSALFSPRFAEGQPTQNKPTRIKLYDDDPESMRFMCAILHHKSTRLSAMAMNRLEMLAVLTDKYDCVNAIYPHYRTLLRISNTRHIEEQDGPSRLLWPVYAFDDAEMFHRLTKFMVMELRNDGKAQTESARYGIPEEVESHLPDDLLETISRAERSIKTEVQIALEQIISPIAAKSTTIDFIPAADDALLSHCDCLSISSLISGLSRQGLWPLTSTSHRLSIKMLCSKLEACNFGLASRITQMKRCAHCPQDVAGQVARIREVALRRFEGLCLDCIRDPGKSPEQRLQCRIPHQNFRGLHRHLKVSDAATIRLDPELQPDGVR